MLHKIAVFRFSKVICTTLMLLTLTQCKMGDLLGDDGAESTAAAMHCTKIISNNDFEYQEYLLQYSEIDSKYSVDCRIVERYGDKPPKAIKVIVRDIGPKTFEGVSECDLASVAPPAPDGRRQPISEGLNQLSFDSQVGVSSYALSLQKCLARIMPEFRADRFSRIENISMRSFNLLNENGGYDLSKSELPTAVIPVAISWRSGKLDGVACAHFVYGSGGNQSLDALEFYKACLYNFSDLSVVGRK